MTGTQIQLFAPAADAVVHWRLLTGNNREAGRAAAGFADVAACRAGVEVVRERVDALQRRVRRAETHRWRWELLLDGAPVVVSGHHFDRMVRCELAVDLFLERVLHAPVGADVLLFGARRWRSVAS